MGTLSPAVNGEPRRSAKNPVNGVRGKRSIMGVPVTRRQRFVKGEPRRFAKNPVNGVRRHDDWQRGSEFAHREHFEDLEAATARR